MSQFVSVDLQTKLFKLVPKRILVANEFYIDHRTGIKNLFLTNVHDIYVYIELS